MSQVASSRQAISRGVVALFKESFGRGPTLGRTFINADVITVLLQDTLTAVERTLCDTGKAEMVVEMRRNYQDAIGTQLIALVERETGRRVKALMSDHSVEPDYAIVCFVLEDAAEISSGAGAGN